MANHSDVFDSGEIFQIIPNTRQIIVPPSHKIIGTTSSHNSEQLTFQCPKLIDNHDVLNCTKHWVVWQNASGKKGRDLIMDLSSDETNMYFRWTVSRDVTAAAGYVSIEVLFEDIVNGVTEYSWGTTTCKDCQVLGTLGFGTGSETVEVPEGYVKPAGTMYIGANGSYDVSVYKRANVDVPQTTLYDDRFEKNGVYTAADGYGYKQVVVNVQPKLQEKTATGNGEIIPDSGFDGLSKVNVDVQNAPKYQSKTVTKNGTVIADEGYDALASVKVEVPDPPLQEREEITPTKSKQSVTPSGDNYGLSEVIVYPIPSEYIKVSGSEEITANGDGIDVSTLKYVDVHVPSQAKDEETANVYLDFASGQDMEIYPTTGKVLKYVTIQMPANLIASNIKKGVTIAGITGTYAGSNGSYVPPDDGGDDPVIPPDDGGDEPVGTSGMMYIGASSSTSVTESTIKTFSSFPAISGNCGFTTSSKGYVYVCVPADKVITSIIMDNFELLGDGISRVNSITVDGQIYDIYRTSSRQIAGSYSYTINIV